MLCAVVSLLTSMWVTRQSQWENHDEVNGHRWLHKELNLTPDQASAIDAFEPEYRERRTELQDQFQAKVDILREDLMKENEFTPQMEETIHELHIIHGQLQELSIRHYFQMLSVLPPEKKNDLRELAGKALSVPQ